MTVFIDPLAVCACILTAKLSFPVMYEPGPKGCVLMWVNLVLKPLICSSPDLLTPLKPLLTHTKWLEMWTCCDASMRLIDIGQHKAWRDVTRNETWIRD